SEFRARFGYPYGLMHRADLHSMLLEACRSSSRVELSPSEQVQDFEDRGDSVNLRTRNGAVHEGAAVIGADGLWSTVRDVLVGDGEPRMPGQIAYRALRRASDVPEANRRNAMTIWAGPQTHLIHYP